MALVDKLNDGAPSFDGVSDEKLKEAKASYYGAEVQRFTSRSLPLADIDELEVIGDELGKLFDVKQ